MVPLVSQIGGVDAKLYRHILHPLQPMWEAHYLNPSP